MQSKTPLVRLKVRRGVTLVEVLAAIVIIAILAAVAWMAIGGRVQAKARRAVLTSDLRQIATSINLYRADHDDGLPSNWMVLGYVAVNRKDHFGPGFPPQDVYYDNPPMYDLRYHTPECAAPPAAKPSIWVFRQSQEAFNSRPRANVFDPDTQPAVSFLPACLPGSIGRRSLTIRRDGEVRTIQFNDFKSIGVNLQGSMSYSYWPDWDLEVQVGN
jgi:prepilin-type N-terminal cleavage/methylation domain-containing protein